MSFACLRLLKISNIGACYRNRLAPQFQSGDCFSFLSVFLVEFMSYFMSYFNFYEISIVIELKTNFFVMFVLN
jgi:hypothetical protein